MIFIKGNAPSLKNSKVKTARGIFSSKTVKKYISSLGIQSYSPSRQEVKGYVNRPNEFEKLRPEFEALLKDKNPPYKVGFHFIRSSKRSCDFNNVNQIIADLMTAHNIIPDDNMDIFLPFPLEIDGKFYSVDKENPGVYVTILD